MAKRRTKKQKIRAKAKRVSFENQPIKEKKKNKKTEKIKKVESEVDTTKTSLIVKDLVKTIWISVVLMGLLIGAYFYLN